MEKSIGAGISSGNLTVLGSWNEPAFHYPLAVLMIEAGFSVHTIVIVFGLFVSVTMGWLTKKHGHDQD